MLITTQLVVCAKTTALFLLACISSSAQNLPAHVENTSQPRRSSTQLVEPESYAVYPALLSQHYREWFSKNKSVAISPYTAVPSHRPGSELIARCESGVDNEIERVIRYLWQSQTKRVEAKLTVPGAYHLVEGKADIREGSEPGIVCLSRIAFSKDRRHAMVWLRNFCGGLCGGGLMWTSDWRDVAGRSPRVFHRAGLFRDCWLCTLRDLPPRSCELKRLSPCTPRYSSAFSAI